MKLLVSSVIFTISLVANINAHVNCLRENKLVETEVVVEDKFGNKINNATFKIVKYGKFGKKTLNIEPQDVKDNQYLFALGEEIFEKNKDWLINSNLFSVEVTAEGFKNSANNLQFYRCKPKYYKVILRKENDNTTTLSGTVSDINGARIPFGEIILKNQTGEFKSKTNEFGEYQIDLQSGSYSLEVKAANFETFKIDKFNIATKYIQEMSLDIVLKIPHYDHHYFSVDLPILEIP